jgi:hypothetical protein
MACDETVTELSRESIVSAISAEHNNGNLLMACGESTSVEEATLNAVV